MSRYAEAHENPAGPGDARPTALQIIQDEGLEGNMKDKVSFKLLLLFRVKIDGH
jgi:hypothetical protein